MQDRFFNLALLSDKAPRRLLSEVVVFVACAADLKADSLVFTRRQVSWAHVVHAPESTLAVSQVLLKM